jgi:hypothetical protein
MLLSPEYLGDHIKENEMVGEGRLENLYENQ